MSEKRLSLTFDYRGYEKQHHKVDHGEHKCQVSVAIVEHFQSSMVFPLKSARFHVVFDEYQRQT